MTILQFHPIADLFPLMPTEGKEWQEFVADICAHGLRMPILLHTDGRILDGRNRYRACLECTSMIVTETFDGTDEEAIDHIVSLNKHRRHLTPAQWAMIGGRVANMKRGGDRKSADQSSRGNFDTSSEQAAKQVGVSRSSVARARSILNTKNDALIKEVESGKKSLRQGYKEATGRSVDGRSKEMRSLLRLVKDLPAGTPPPERKPAAPISIDRYLRKIVRIIGNLLRNDRYFRAIVAEKHALSDEDRRESAIVLRNFAKELNGFANSLWPDEERDDGKILDGTCR